MLNFLSALLKIVYLNIAFYAGTKASKSIKSSVRVPVLSKHAKETAPPVMILLESIQNILISFNLFTALITPKAILMGRAGGTVMTIKSKNFMKMSVA